MSWIWVSFIVTLIFAPLVVWPLNSAFLMLKDMVGYTFTGADEFALQVMTICTGYILFFVVIAAVFRVIIASKSSGYDQGGGY